MSSPTPPNQPWQGGPPPQQGEGEQSQEQRPGQPPQQDNPALSTPGPTQALQPGQQPHQFGADGVERTQAIQPGQQPPGGVGEATQVVNPVNYGGQHPQQPDSGQTQMVPPGSMPPQQPPYAPPPGADSQGPGGFGQQQGGFGQQPPPGYGGPPPGGGFGQQQPGGFGQQQGGFGQQPPPGYGPPPGGFAQQQGLGAGPTFGGQGQNLQMISWAIAGLVGVLGLVCALWAVSDDIFSGDLGDYSDSVADLPTEGIASPGFLYISSILVIVSGLAAIGAGVLIFLKHKMAAMVTVGAGGALLVSAILYLIAMGQFDVDTGDAPFSNVKVFALIAGLLVGGAGALGFFPQTRKYLGGESVLAGPGGPGGPPSGGFGQPQQGFGQQPPQQGFGGPPSGGFGQQPPQQGFGQPPQQGGPPQQW